MQIQSQMPYQGTAPSTPRVRSTRSFAPDPPGPLDPRTSVEGIVGSHAGMLTTYLRRDPKNIVHEGSADLE